MSVARIEDTRPHAPGRIPPHNLQAEESLLGAMLLSRDAIAAAVEVVSADDFYRPAHGHVFEAVCSLYSAGEPADPVTVAEELSRAGLLDAIGGPATLISLQAHTPATSSASKYARIVEELALLRRLIGVANEVAEIAFDVPDDVTTAIDRAEAMVYEVAQRRVTDTMAPLRDLLSANLDRLEQLYERGEAITGIPSGYHDVDELLSGLQPSALVVVGARPSMGKCVKWDTLIVDPSTGARHTVQELCEAGSHGETVTVPALADDERLTVRAPSAFVDDGHKHIWRVRTRLGREVATTATHPFLTPDGWRPLSEIRVGQPIAVPGVLPFFGTRVLRDDEVEVLAHLTAVTDRVPDAVFELPAPQVALFLNRLLGTNASAWWSDAGPGHGGISLPTASEQLASDVQHLLLRFGCKARLHRFSVVDHGVRRPSFQVDLTEAEDVLALAERIGICGQEAALADLGERMREHHEHAVGQPNVRASASRRQAQGDSATEHGAGGVLLLERPDPPTVPLGAGPSDIFWDEIVSIAYEGEHQVYDLTVPVDHNFVADDVFVHNTAFALGMASHAAIESRRPVLFFSLEMSQLELTQRILCSEARVDSRRVRNGRLAEADWQKISHAVGRLAEAPLYIDDNPHVTVMEIRAKARRLKSRLGDLGLVVVDYLQLMTGRSGAESRQVEVSEISRGLKILARELEAPVVALSQLSRGLEMRQDKRPILADLRESGCLTADTVIVRADTGRATTMAELLREGARDIPIWTLDEHYKLVRGVMSHVFPSGTKPVYEMRLASGRSIKASANHPFLALEGWFPLERLDVGDRLAVPRAGSWPPAVGDAVHCSDTIPRELWAHLRKSLPNLGLDLKDLEQKLGVDDFVESFYANELTRVDLRRLAEVVPDPFLRDLATSDVYWDTIVGLDELGEQPVYDAAVPRTHNFIASGIVVHNSIEQDADVVMFIYRDQVYNTESTDQGLAEILVSKHRNGPTGMARLAFLDHYTKFANMPKGV